MSAFCSQADWQVYLPILSKDPRFNSPSLSPPEKHRLFLAHLSHLQTKRLSALHALFATHAPTLQTPFFSIHSLLAPEFAVTRLKLTADQLEDEYARWQRTRDDLAKREFAEMMGENAFVQFWGGMRKAEGEGEEERRLRRGGGGLGGNEESDSEEEEGEEGGGKGDMLGMAKKIDLREIEAVLKVSRVVSFLPVEAARN